MDSEKDGKNGPIFEPREGAAAKARAERELAATGTASGRDALLAAQLDGESKAQDVIELCQECGERHATNTRHHARSRVSDRRDNVILVDFRPATERP